MAHTKKIVILLLATAIVCLSLAVIAYGITANSGVPNSYGYNGNTASAGSTSYSNYGYGQGENSGACGYGYGSYGNLDAYNHGPTRNVGGMMGGHVKGMR